MINVMSLSGIQISMIILWIIIVVAAIIIEFETVELVSIWFAGGAIAGAVCAVLEQPIWLQFLLFAVVSAVFVLGTRPFVKKISDNQTILTNVDRFVGMVAQVTKPIEIDKKGEIEVEFQKWTAVTKKNKDFQVGDRVVIVEISGNKMIVDEIEEIDV